MIQKTDQKEYDSTKRRTRIIARIMARIQANKTELERLQKLFEKDRSEVKRLLGELRLLSQTKDKEHRDIQERNKTLRTRNHYLREKIKRLSSKTEN